MSDEHFDGSFLAKGGKEAHDTSMELRDRIAKLEASFDWMKVITTLSMAIMLGGFALLANQMLRLESRLDGRIDRLEAKADRLDTKMDGINASLGAKIDAIPTRLSEEFRAMRAEMAAQTAAIASSVTAARAVQPQILVMPPTPTR